jgi:hypothetical protein
MQVGMADACAANPDQDLSWGGGGPGNILYFSRATDADESDGLHGCSFVTCARHALST